MTRVVIRNLAASMRQRLLDLARREGLEFQRVLVRFGTERFLHRLERSPHRDAFVLKGAILFTVWRGAPHRATRDADFLGFGDATPDRVAAVFREIIEVAPAEPDGLLFDPASVRTAPIREEAEYGGIRVKLTARLDSAEIPLQFDVGFGDAVVPPPEIVTLPVLLSLPAPALRAYTREGSVAEKFQAMVALGDANGRMKDFYDVWLLASGWRFEMDRLAGAVEATFARRRTAIPDAVPVGLTADFAGSAAARMRWRQFVDRSGTPPETHRTLADVVRTIEEFLMPVCGALVAGTARTGHWPAGGPWQEGPGA